MNDNLYIDNPAKSSLKEIAKWAKFLAIVGFVACGFMVIIAFLMGTLFSLAGNSRASLGFFPPLALTILYLLIAALYFFPCLFLYRSSVKINAAVDNMDSGELSLGLEQLKKTFKFVGIYTLVVICLYGLILLFAALGGGMAFFSGAL